LENKITDNKTNIKDLIETLRGENGCPWDKKQTSGSISLYLLEEVYELLEAIDSGTSDEVCEELGDVLFHIFFIAALFDETGDFNIEDVTAMIIQKMIRRHPHVFGDEKIENVQEVKQRWHEIKLKEKSKTKNRSILDSIPSKLPALMRSYRISERAAKTGFDWDDISGVMLKAKEEWNEFILEIKKNKNGTQNQNSIEMEFGDLLFTLVNVARFANIHPETSLSKSVKKFEKRFKFMEKEAEKSCSNLNSISHDEMNILWEKAKEYYN